MVVEGREDPVKPIVVPTPCRRKQTDYSELHVKSSRISTTQVIVICERLFADLFFLCHWVKIMM